MYVPNKPAGQTHWIPVKTDEPSHGEGASRAFYGTIFKDVSGCRAASVITQLRPRIFFFLLHVSVLELLSGGKKLFFSPPSFFPRILNCPEVCLTSFRAAITQLPVFLSIFYEIHLVTVLLRWPFILSNRKGTAM